MRTQVIVLNGGSSAGKSGIVRCLQAILPDPWLATGVDRLIEAMSYAPKRSRRGCSPLRARPSAPACQVRGSVSAELIRESV